METVANRIIEYLDTDKKIWNDVERMRMALGLQVLIHNIVMIGTILLTAVVLGIFSEAVVLLTAYGILKMSAGGIHFKSSLACLVGTGIFVIFGTKISDSINIELRYVVIIYLICIFILTLIGPQGTENNPITVENYVKLRKRTIIFVSIYLLITIFMAFGMKNIPYLLLIAVVFET